MTIERNTLLSYVTPRGAIYEAIARRIHRDGSVTVEARFELDGNGRRIGSYVGHRYRIDSARLLSA